MPHKRKRHRFTRKELISALGLDAEGKTRMQKYAASTGEFLKKVKTGDSVSARRARKKLGIE
jgi:hypothetical protein